jgi:cytosine/adenosine deaminase-related metal-dependent hydrolase
VSPGLTATPRLLIDGCAVATVDASRTEITSGHVLVAGARLVAVDAGPAPTSGEDDVRRIDGRGCLATPGLVNCHHHLYQWLTRGAAQQATLFQWLTELYPVWAGLDEELEYAAARAGLAMLLGSGCTTSMDHHYIFPPAAGDLLAAEVAAAAELGIRFVLTRGSMDLGRSAGGLPPEELVEDRDRVLAATEEVIDRYHDPAAEAMLQVAVAPCSPFSVTEGLLTDAAEVARRRGVRLHTHLAETHEEEDYCRARFGRTPIQYLDDLGWLGGDVWLAHGVHLDAPAVRRLAQTGTGIAHCPSSNARLGAGMAPVAALLAAGVPVGLGVDGAASNEAGELLTELRQALLLARLRDGPAALSARQALELATVGGARCLGRSADLGSLEPGKLADLALWRLDDLGHGDIDDPVAALVLGPPTRLEVLLVGGRVVVEGGELRTAQQPAIARDVRQAAAALRRRAGVAAPIRVAEPR